VVPLLTPISLILVSWELTLILEEESFKDSSPTITGLTLTTMGMELTLHQLAVEPDMVLLNELP